MLSMSTDEGHLEMKLIRHNWGSFLQKGIAFCNIREETKLRFSFQIMRGQRVQLQIVNQIDKFSEVDESWEWFVRNNVKLQIWWNFYDEYEHEHENEMVSEYPFMDHCFFYCQDTRLDKKN